MIDEMTAVRSRQAASYTTDKFVILPPLYFFPSSSLFYLVAAILAAATCRGNEFFKLLELIDDSILSHLRDCGFRVNLMLRMRLNESSRAICSSRWRGFVKSART